MKTAAVEEPQAAPPLLRSIRYRWWLAQATSELMPRLGAALEAAFAEASRTGGPLVQTRTHLLPPGLAIVKPEGQPRLVAWLATRIVSPRFAAMLSTRLLERLLAIGVSRELTDHVAPGPWSVALLAGTIEAGSAARAWWRATTVALGPPRAADATLLALWGDPGSRQAMRGLVAESAATDAGSLLDLVSCLHDWCVATPTAPFPTTPLARAWLLQLATRGLRRSWARRLGASAAAAGLVAWPTWLTWPGDDCPAAFTWMAVEWLLARLRTAPAAARRDLVGSELLPVAARSGPRRIVLPERLRELCEATREGDDIAAWTTSALADLPVTGPARAGKPARTKAPRRGGP
ncbi:MAG: hypothetical protein IPK26_20360 [Planctomycetes bacterium]|nr:hypothetical protein [Planctomycetota bacterium]